MVYCEDNAQPRVHMSIWICAHEVVHRYSTQTLYCSSTHSLHRRLCCRGPPLYIVLFSLLCCSIHLYTGMHMHTKFMYIYTFYPYTIAYHSNNNSNLIRHGVVPLNGQQDWYLTCTFGWLQLIGTTRCSAESRPHTPLGSSPQGGCTLEGLGNWLQGSVPRWGCRRRQGRAGTAS